MRSALVGCSRGVQWENIWEIEDVSEASSKKRTYMEYDAWRIQRRMARIRTVIERWYSEFWDIWVVLKGCDLVW